MIEAAKTEGTAKQIATERAHANVIPMQDMDIEELDDLGFNAWGIDRETGEEFKFFIKSD